MSDSETRRDARPLVFAVAAWAAAWAGTAAIGWAGAVAVAALTVAVVGWRRSSRLTLAVALTAGVVLSGAAARTAMVQHGPIADLAAEGAVVVVTGRVGEGREFDAGPGGSGWLVPMTVSRLAGRGQVWASGATVLVTVSGSSKDSWQQVAPGVEVTALARLSRSDDAQYAAWARAAGQPAQAAAPSWSDAAVNAVRAGLRRSAAELPPEAAALVPALVVGDVSTMPASLVEQFRATGLTHLTAVSGANLTLLLASVLWLAARLGVLGWWRRGLSVLVVVGFVALCRAEPSVLRAAAMGLVGLAALGWGRPRQGLRYLSWAVVALVVVDPWLARSVGFALSVLATGGIVLFSRRWTDVAAVWAPRWLAEAVTVPLAAQLVTQPLVSAISGQVSVVGLAANLLAGPLVGPATVLGLAAAAVSVPLPAVGVGLAWAAGGFAQGLVWIAAVGSSVPGAWLAWPSSPVAVVLLVVICAVALAVMPWLLARRSMVLVLAVVLVGAWLHPLNPPGWPPQGWLIVSCDVGQGDATVIRAGESAAIVVDAGPDSVAVDRCLDQLGIDRVPWLVFTHPHADHIGGMAGVVDRREVERVLLPAPSAEAGGWAEVRAAAGASPVVTAAPGMVVSAGMARLSVLAAGGVATALVVGADSAEENDSSLLVRVDVGGVRLLVAGDLQEAGQDAARAAVADLSADVLLVPHHGSSHQSEAFLAAAHARIALISVGADNDYGHPAARTVVAVAGTGAQVFRTDLSGSLAVTCAAEGLAVTVSRAG